MPTIVPAAARASKPAARSPSAPDPVPPADFPPSEVRRRRAAVNPYKIVSASRTNREARAILADARALLARIEAYHEDGTEHAAELDLLAAGFNPDRARAIDTMMLVGRDLSGFQWVLNSFCEMLDCDSLPTPEELETELAVWAEQQAAKAEAANAGKPAVRRSR